MTLTLVVRQRRVGTQTAREQLSKARRQLRAPFYGSCQACVYHGPLKMHHAEIDDD